jgi:hypothetical protein
MARLEAAFATLEERGVVAGWRRTGPARRNALEGKVAIRMSSDYLALYDHARLRRQEQEHRRFLEAPFAPEGRKTAGRMARGAASKNRP